MNFLAAHDGFTLADSVSYENRHNLANGEENRDGHGENFSWNNGVEGPSSDPHIGARRAEDLRAMLGTLFVSTGTIMLTAGDEFGRTQRGNNNAYCQDNELAWLDWNGRDRELEAHVARLSEWRVQRLEIFQAFPEDGQWRSLSDAPLTAAEWEVPDTPGLRFTLGMADAPVAIEVDRRNKTVTCR